MILEQREFHFEAQTQRICRGTGCRKRWPWHPHHVIYRQELERLGLSVALLWDPRNCLRLCPDCHMNHHNRSKPVKLTALRDANYAFAFEVMGALAVDYLRQKYDGEDPRLDAWAAKYSD